MDNLDVVLHHAVGEEGGWTPGTLEVFHLIMHVFYVGFETTLGWERFGAKLAIEISYL